MNKPSYKDIFHAFLQKYLPAKADALMPVFEQFLDELFSLNQQINMVSRQMPKEDYWLYHFLDSLLILKCMDLKGGTALDFGSGGGLPGIPIKLIKPEIKMTLLDSVGKKIKCIQTMIKDLALQDCSAVWCRLEDYAKDYPGRGFDYIFCRSVKIEDAFIKPLSKLLHKDGLIVFYKANQMDDVIDLSNHKVCDVSLPELGQRKIVTATAKNLLTYIKDRKLS